MKNLTLLFFLLVTFLSFQLNAGDSKKADYVQDFGPELSDSLDSMNSDVNKLQQLISAAKSVGISSQNGVAILKKASKLSSLIFTKFCDSFKFVVDKCDKITSKKFFLAAAIIISPAVAFYSLFFDSNILFNLFNKLFTLSSKSATDAGAAFAKGAIEGAASSVYEHKGTALEIAGVGVVAYTGWAIFKQAVDDMARTAAPHITKAAAWGLGLIPMFVASTRDYFLLHYGFSPVL